MDRPLFLIIIHLLEIIFNDFVFVFKIKNNSFKNVTVTHLYTVWNFLWTIIRITSPVAKRSNISKTFDEYLIFLSIIFWSCQEKCNSFTIYAMIISDSRCYVGTRVRVAGVKSVTQDFPSRGDENRCVCQFCCIYERRGEKTDVVAFSRNHLDKRKS